MKIVFVHQNFPGQFGRLADIFASEGHEVVALGTVPKCAIPGVAYYPYSPVPGPDAARSGTVSARDPPCPARLRRREPGPRAGAAGLPSRSRRGEHRLGREPVPQGRLAPRPARGLFRILLQCQVGQDVDFDPEFPVQNEETIWRLRLKNAMQLAALDVADAAVAPTRYQRDTFPAYLRDRIEVIHDGIEAQSPGSRSGRRDSPCPGRASRSTRQNPVVTYVTRNIEPMRGSHVVLESLPGLLALDPELQVIVVGGTRR